MIKEYDVYLKLKEVSTLIEQYQRQSYKSDAEWYKYMLQEMDGITKKRHVLNASGVNCRRCGGSGVEP
jgi:ribosomal protein L18E